MEYEFQSDQYGSLFFAMKFVMVPDHCPNLAQSAQK